MYIAPYTPLYQSNVIQALIELQNHEHALSDTRKASSSHLGEEYFRVMLERTIKQNGKILVCLMEQEFAGFVSYFIEKDMTLFEEDDSNCYALISDICILPEFRKQGVARHLFHAVFKELRNQKYYGRVRICSLANNMMALHAYESYGFKPYEIIFEKKVGKED